MVYLVVYSGMALLLAAVILIMIAVAVPEVRRRLSFWAGLAVLAALVEWGLVLLG